MHYFSGKGCSESLESMHYCIGILTTDLFSKLLQNRSLFSGFRNGALRGGCKLSLAYKEVRDIVIL